MSNPDPNDRDWEGNLIAQYHYYLREAFVASDKVDNFDLHSEDEESRRKWKDLRRDSFESSMKLLRFIHDNANSLRAQLELSNEQDK